MMRGSIVGVLALASCVLAACSDERTPTQIVVVVDSDWDGLARLAIEIDNFGRKDPINADLHKQHLPRRFVLVNDGGPLGPIAITVRAFTDDATEPALVESRTELFFERGAARLLTINLPYACVGHACASDESCVAGPSCVASDSAGKLVAWSGPPKPHAVTHFVDAGALGMNDAAAGERDGGSTIEAAVPERDGDTPIGDTGQTTQAGDSSVPTEAGTIHDGGTFAYSPANFVPDAGEVAAAERVAAKISCQAATFDSTTLGFENWCGPEPKPIVVRQSDGSDAALLALSSLQIASGASLVLRGARPVILAVFGDVAIDGVLDASAHGEESGPGAERDCAQGDGGNGSSQGQGMSTVVGGGGGGGFGTAGALGGEAVTASGRGGAIVGSAALSPLRGGCRGGSGGYSTSEAHGGGGGGAVQISASGRIALTGVISVGGGGGQGGSASGSGGGGGGSGGAILLEAGTFALDTSATLAANGGGGGGGQAFSVNVSSTTAKAGNNGLANLSPADGGSGGSLSGAGGGGAALGTEASAGMIGNSSFGTSAAGGGGGGTGRIRVQQASDCQLDLKQSPIASVTCASCGTCSVSPGVDCKTLEYDAHTLYRCDAALSLQDARTRCQAVALDVLAVRDAALNDWLKTQVASDTWIGATDAVQEGSWLWLRDGLLFWSGDASGSPTSGAFSQWGQNEPNNISGQAFNADCATIGTDGTWHDRGCTETHPYICE